MKLRCRLGFHKWRRLTAAERTFERGIDPWQCLHCSKFATVLPYLKKAERS